MTRQKVHEGNNKRKTKENVRQKLNSAIQAGRERDYRTALLILEQLISCSDAPADAYLFMGRALHALKDYSRAIACFNDYTRLAPHSAQGRFFAGRSYLSMGMPGKAVPLFRKAHELDPHDIYNQALLGTAYLKSRHSQLAVDTLQEVVETAAAREMPEKLQARFYRAYINALLVRGINLCRIDDYELGGQMLRFVLDNGGDNTLLRLELGIACRELGENRRALEHFTRALEFKPDDTRIRWYRTSLLMALGDHEQALKELDKIRSLDSALPELPWNSLLVDLYMIRSFLATHEWRRSADCSRLWIKQYGHNPLIHAMFAEAQRNLRNFTAAYNHLEHALKAEPRNINLWYEQLMTAWEGEDWKLLEKSLRNIKKINGEDDIYRRFNMLLKAKTAPDEKHAIALLQKAIGSLGPEPELMLVLGEYYLKIGLAELALNWFKKIITIQKHHEKAWLGCISALEILSTGEGRKKPKGLLKKAERQEEMSLVREIAEQLLNSYDEYIKRWPDNFKIRRDRALYLIRTFEFPLAVSELEALLAWEPSNFSLRRVLAYAYRKTGRYREAAVYLKTMLREKPHDLDILLEYTGCLERSGSSQYAIQLLEKAREFFKQNCEITMSLGLLYAKKGNLEKAFALLLEAAALNKKDPRPYQLMAKLAAQKGDKAGAKKYQREADNRTRPS